MVPTVTDRARTSRPNIANFDLHSVQGEIVADVRRKHTQLAPLTINGAALERVTSTKFLALLASGDAFRLGLSQHAMPLRPPAALFQDKSPAQSLLIQELVRMKRDSFTKLVRAQPHLVHDMGWPEIHETSGSQAKMELSNSSQLNAPHSGGQDVARTAAVEESMDVEDEMERMVHLAVLRDANSYRGQPDSADPEAELRGGPGASDASHEASGFYGMDMEERDRGEEGGEDQFRREGEEEWERDAGEDSSRREENVREKGERTDGHGDLNHTTPDLDALIGCENSHVGGNIVPSWDHCGYTAGEWEQNVEGIPSYTSSLNPSKDPSSSFPAEVHDSGLQEHRASPILEVSPLERELWEAQREEEAQSSGYGVLRSSVAAAGTSAGTGHADGTASPETDTGTDFGLLGGYTTGEIQDEETKRGDEEGGLTHTGVFTQNPTAPEVGLAPSRRPLQPSVEEEEQLKQGQQILRGFGLKDESGKTKETKWRTMERENSGIRRIIPLTTGPSPTIDFTEPELEPNLEEPRQVVCLNWSELAGRGYVILNMTQNMNCEEFRACMGVRLLKIIEQVFARRMNSPEGSWVLYLSKPTHQQHQLLMNVASGHGVIETQDVLDMLGEIRKSLNKVGIQNYSAASSCQSRPSKTRSDYGKLFVVLVIIGSICMVIITSGFIYICWQRRLPSAKTMFRAEELHHVENGYHDNPTLDVTNDSQPEMQEKKPSANGLAGVGDGVGEDSSRWQVFVNQAATEEDEEEQDTHL
ncbi:uncharacterized protein podxl2 [Xenentodon cancila]